MSSGNLVLPATAVLKRALWPVAVALAVLGPPLLAPTLSRYDSRPQPKLEKGKLLVASRDLSDPNFSETVILLVAYGPNGTIGIILNRPSDVKLATVLPDIKTLRRRPDAVYLGGPVLTNRVLLLIRSSKAPGDSLLVFDDVYASSGLTTLGHTLERQGSKDLFRAYAGHAGWAPGQLEAEIDRGDWYVTGTDAATVFTKSPKQLWQTLMPRVEGDWVWHHRRKPHVASYRAATGRRGECCRSPLLASACECRFRVRAATLMAHRSSLLNTKLPP